MTFPLMAFTTWGTDGPTVVLLHGVGGVSGLWEPIARRLAERRRVVAVDLRGHGRSADITGGLSLADFTEDLDRFLRAEAPGAVTLIGHSFGGCIALNYAALAPGRVSGVAAVEVVIYPPGWEIRPRPDLVERARKRVNNWADRAEMRAFLAERPVHRRWRPDLLDIYVRDCAVDRPDGRVEAHFGPELEARFIETTYAEARYIIPWPHLAGIRCPALVVRAEESLWLKTETLAAVARTIADCETADIPGTGHFVILEQPDSVAGLLVDWLDRRCPV
jgi:pimeloyl-ACP methyl ester carboxylesterase